MKVGIIGCGKIARLHCPIILKQPKTRIVGLVDRNMETVEALGKEFIIDNCYQDSRLMIDREKPDVVHVLTPPQSHAELAIMAMSRGCHVLVEKPMALSVDNASAMIEVAKQNKVQLCVNHCMVFEDVVQRAMALASSDIIGEVVSVEVSQQFDARRNPAIWEEGAEYCHWFYGMNGGPLQDFMPHPASVIMEFIPEIQEVQFVGHNRGVLPKGWQDEVKVLIKSQRIIGYISISFSEKPDIELVIIKGTKGTVEANLFTNILTLRRKSPLPRAAARGLLGFQLSLQYLRESFRNVYKFSTGRMSKSGGTGPVISKFYESIRNGGETPVSLDKSLRVVDLTCKVWPKPLVDAGSNTRPLGILKKSPNKPNTLVTGASGLIGTHLVNKLLSENVKVRALVRPNSIHAGRLAKLDVDILEGDLGNPEILYQATRGVKTVFHAGFPTSSTSWEECEKVAVQGTKHLLDAALANKIERFIHFSSLAVYELLNTNSETIKEDSPYRKKRELMGPYAWAKIEIERLAFAAHRKQGLGVTVMRPGIVIGPMGRLFFPHLGYRYQDRLFLLIGKGNNILPLTYVENTVDAIYEASRSEAAIGEAYNIVDDGEITPKRFLQKLVEVTGIHAHIIPLPYIIPYSATTVYEIASYLGLLKPGLTSRAQLKSKRARLKFDNAKIKDQLAWQPRIPLEEGLKKTFAWYAEKYHK